MSSDANGSSSSTTSGSGASARASATRWRSPPDSSCGYDARSVGEADERQALVDPPGPGVAEADVAGDREVREERAVLEDHADAAVLGLDPHAGARDLRPPMATVPASGISNPAMIRSSVVLPEPLGPRSATSCALLDGDRRTRDRARRRRTSCWTSTASMASGFVTLTGASSLPDAGHERLARDGTRMYTRL